MATDLRDVKDKVDEKILELLPAGGQILETASLGLSDFCDTVSIEVGLPDGSTARYFEKRASGLTGLRLITAHWHSETEIFKFIPEYIPKPVGWGSYQSNPNIHFFLLEWVDMIDDDFPRVDHYIAPLSALHLRSMGKSPTGKYGFQVTTMFGSLPQDNSWESSWEIWWTKHMKEVLGAEYNIHGEYTPEGQEIVTFFMNRVLPRYLQPLETDGRSIQPTLMHTDLWPGNIKYKLDNESVMVYDANAFWAHNEMELGLFRNPRYPLGRTFLKRYWKDVPVSAPEEDADSRNIMYLVRNQVCLATVYPGDTKMRDIFLNTMKLLVDRVKAEDMHKEGKGDAPTQTADEADAALQQSQAGTTYVVAGVTTEARYNLGV